MIGSNTCNLQIAISLDFRCTSGCCVAPGRDSKQKDVHSWDLSGTYFVAAVEQVKSISRPMLGEGCLTRSLPWAVSAEVKALQHAGCSTQVCGATHHFTKVIGAEVHASRPPVDLVIVQAGPANGGCVEDRCHVHKVVQQKVVEEGLIPVLQSCSAT